MELKDFEQHIDPVILDRGHDYFTSGLVNEPDELRTGQFEATVLGSMPYNVRITLQGKQISRYSCSCPYDHGPICKHVVALLYYLRGNAEERSAEQSQKPSKRKTVVDEIDELLAEIPREDLVDFSRNLAINDKQYRNKLMSAFVHLNQDESKALYARQVRGIVEAAAGNHEYGYIGWQETAGVAQQVFELLDTAEKQADNDHYKSALYICFAVMEEMLDTLGYVDDSNGDISGCIYSACNLLYDIAAKPEGLPEPDRRAFYEACFSAFEEGTFSGWDWHMDMLDLLSMLYKTEEEGKHVLELIERAPLSGYELERAQHTQLQIIEDLKSGEEASQFIADHISNSRISKAAIEKAVEKKEYEKAITIAKAGIKQDQKDKPGLVHDWHQQLLRIARLQNNREKIIRYARKLFMAARFEKQHYYDLLKEQVPDAEWTGFLEDLVADIKKNNRWLDVGLIAKIYINEQWWDRLFDLVMKKPSLEKVESYQHYLSDDYAKEIANFYEQGTLRLMKRNTGRKYYQQACRFIREIAALGSKDQAEKLVKKLESTYPRRPALRDELSRLSF